MPSISAWRRVSKVPSCRWLASLSSCRRTGPAHPEISTLRPSPAPPSYWPGRSRFTTQTKSLPTPSTIWKLKVSTGLRIVHGCEGSRLGEIQNEPGDEPSHPPQYEQCFSGKAIWCCTEQRSRRAQKGNLIGIKTGLASALSAPKLQLKGQCSFLKVSQGPKKIFYLFDAFYHQV